jgi:hypothetical protein
MKFMEQRISFPGTWIALIGLLSLASAAAEEPAAATPAPAIPFAEALARAAVVQEKMAADIPGSLILGNGDLNGVLMLHGGHLRLWITKNDACDGRLDTAKDPDLVKIDIPNHKWTNPPHAINPPSWANLYPCPLNCGYVDFIAREAGPSIWAVSRSHLQAALAHDEKTGAFVARIEGKPSDTAGWGFVPKIAGKAQRVVFKVSGSANAKWFADLGPGGGNSGWIAATEQPSETSLAAPANQPPAEINFYVWTDDGKPAEVRLQSVVVIDGKGMSQTQHPMLEAEASLPPAKLDLARAAAFIGDPAQPEITARVLAGHNAMVFETADAVSLAPCSAPFIPASPRGTDDGVEWILTTVPGDVDWPGMSFAIAHAAEGKRHAVAMVTSLENKDPKAAALALARATLAADPAPQIAAHEAAWREFWSKSGVDLSDAYLESVWYRNLYFLRCWSKPGVPPVGLFLGCLSDVMPWHGVPTTDYNFEQCFWGAFDTNHSELAEPYNQSMVDYLPRGKWFAKETYGLAGAFYPVNHFTHQIDDPALCKSKNQHMNFYLPWTYVPGADGWQVQNLWLAYLHHPNRAYLEKTAYPVLKEMAIFYAAFLDQCKKAKGKAIYGPSYSPEHRDYGVDDTACDIAFTRLTLKAAIESAKILGGDDDLAAQWEKALALVPDYPVVPNSKPPIISDVRGGNKIEFNVVVPALPVFPAGEVNWWSPEEEKQIFAQTVETASWTGYNSSMILAGARARLSMPGTFEWIKKTFQERQMPSGYLLLMGGGYGRDTRGNYSEQVAATGIVSEMLMQGVGGIIRVFPAWPAEHDGKFANLSAERGFLVGAEQAGGVVTRIDVESTVGGTLRLLSPWPTVRAGNRALTPDAQGIVTLETQAGERFQFTSK